jgi:hypothetical protein
MDEKLDRLDIDPTLDCPEASYRIADGERKAVLPLPAIGRAEPEELRHPRQTAQARPVTIAAMPRGCRARLPDTAYKLARRAAIL